LLGHDLIVSEKEERTLRLLIASGLSRSQLLFGKFLGGCLSVALPLLAGDAETAPSTGVAARGPFHASFIAEPA
jgi:ABC-type Na+ efflux pump permease subunit